MNKICSLKVFPLQVTSTYVETPDSLFTIVCMLPEKVNGTNPADKSVISRENFVARSYPNPLPPKVGIDNPPDAMTRDLQEILSDRTRSLFPLY